MTRKEILQKHGPWVTAATMITVIGGAILVLIRVNATARDVIGITGVEKKVDEVKVITEKNKDDISLLKPIVSANKKEIERINQQGSMGLQSLKVQQAELIGKVDGIKEQQAQTNILLEKLLDKKP